MKRSRNDSDKNNLNQTQVNERTYETPSDNKITLRSGMMQNLLALRHMAEEFKLIADMAFDVLDVDQSGQLDEEEITGIMKEVANNMKVDPPTSEDISTILQELDEDFDGQVSKDEFNSLIQLVIGKMIQNEEEHMDKAQKL